MADQIIDISRYLQRETHEESPAGTIALWGVDGERSRFALPLWRIVHLAEADRGVILWRLGAAGGEPRPFVAIDLASDPVRLDLSDETLARCGESESATLSDLGTEGLVVFLGSRDGRAWWLIADGGDTRQAPLEAQKREDVLFLAGECAGLLFLRDFADQAEAPVEEDDEEE